MNWQVIHLGEVPPSPWRNGGGVTRELVAWPHAQDWRWRMSVAEVTQGGPFSVFDGVQRWFAVLGGAGVCLTLDGSRHALSAASVPFCFDGATPVDCQLLDGATQDFNLMLRGDTASAQMRRIKGDISVRLDAPKTVAVYAIDTQARLIFNDGSLTLPAHSLAWQSLPAGVAVQVAADHALWMEIAT